MVDKKRVTGVWLAVIGLAACSPDLSSYQETVIGNCIKAAVDEERVPDCMTVDARMERAFLKKHPTFKEDYLREKRQAQADQQARYQRYSESQAALRKQKALEACAEATLSMIECKGAFCDWNERDVAALCPDFSQDEIAAGVQKRRESREAKTVKARQIQDRATQAWKQVSGQ